MTPQEFTDKMLVIKKLSGDEEVDHVKGDALLCQALEELGYGEGVAIWRSLEKWYA
jgi:hypothetical protein